MKKLKFIIALFTLGLAFILSSCGNGNIVGKWLATDGDGNFSDEYFVVYEFTEDKKAKLDTYIYGINESSVVCDYYTDGNYVIINEDGEERKYKFSRDEDKLEIKDGSTVISSFNAYSLDYNNDKSIIGTWHNKENSANKYKFENDGKGEFTGSNQNAQILYSTSGGNLYVYMTYIINNEGETISSPALSKNSVIKMNYTVSENTLTISLDGEEYIFERENNGTF